jgi:hypothetical protein
VEASSNSIADLGASVNEAVALGANVVSNSYGGPEYSGDRYPRRHRDGVEWHR